MSIKYKVVGCSNPKGAEGVDYACNRAYSEQSLTPVQIVLAIERDTTCTRADIVAVVSAMGMHLREHLLAGQMCDLKDGVTDLGIIEANVKSKCFAQSVIPTDAFDPGTYIKGVGIRWRQSPKLKRAIANAKFQNVKSSLYPVQ